MAIDLIVPALGESISEAVVAKWLKNIGEPVALDEPVAELETDKVTVELPAPAAGVLSGHRVAAGETVRVGDSIGTIEAGAQPAAQPAPVANPSGNGASKASAAPVAQAAPVAPPVAQVPSVADAAPANARPLPPSQRRAILEGHAIPQASFAPPTAAKAPRPIIPRDDEEVVQMTPLRRTIATRLVEAQHTAAILTTFNEVDMSAVMELRSRFQESFVAKHGIKLGFMSFFAKACVEALKEYPGVNAELHDTSIIYKKHYDLGIAVGGGKGLVVPVVRAVDRMGFAEIEQAVADLGQRARQNRLTLDELSGGTFSITNGGIYGSMMSTPLLNMPQTGILGMHNIVRRPVVVGAGANERVEIRPMMYLALSYDHRVVDGREAVQFLVAVKQRLEAPERMLFSV